MAGWRHAYDELVDQRYPALLAYASLLTGSADEAGAVTRSALVRVFGRLRPPSTTDAAETAVRQEIVRKAAAGRRRAAAPPAPTESEAVAGDSAEREGTEARERLRALDPVTRACVVLRHADELPIAEVAARLRIGADDVRARLAEAGDHMGELVDRDSAADDIMFIEVRRARRRG